MTPVDDLISAAVNDEFIDLDEIDQRSVAGPFDELEAQITRTFRVSITYPTVIRNLYGFVFPELDGQIIRFLASPATDPLGPLRTLAFDCYDPPSIVGLGLLPVAEDGNDGGPLVVDCRNGEDPNNAPVKLWDHERRSVGALLYPNTKVLLAAAAHLLGGGNVIDLGSLGAPNAAHEYRFWGGN